MSIKKTVLLLSYLGLFCQGPSGTISTIAGTDSYGFTADAVQATSAPLYRPSGVAIAPDGSVLIADRWNHRIRKVRPDGIIATVAGTGAMGFSGDDGPATSASLYYPSGVAAAADGSILIADEYNNRIRRVATNGIITTVAGSGGAGFGGDSGRAISAMLNHPSGVAVGVDASILIADEYNHRVRRVTPDGVIRTIAGSNAAGFSGDGGQATSALLRSPNGVAVAQDGAVLIADRDNNRVRKVFNGLISTVAGSNTSGFAGDGGLANNAQLYGPTGVALASDGSILIADNSNHRIRRVETDGRIYTIAGGTYGFSGDGLPASSAQLYNPAGIAVAADGSVFIADLSNHRIRKITFSQPANQVLPQLAFGGGWYSALYFANTTDQPVSMQLQITGDDGRPLVVPALSSSTVVVNLTPRGSAIVEAPNVGGLAQGYVSVPLPLGVIGYGVFRQSGSGGSDQEAVVPLASASATSSKLIWDDTNYTTAVAIVNPSTTNTIVAVTVRDSSGTVTGTSSIPLAAGNKTATTLRSLPGLAGVVGNRGSAEFSVTSGSVAVLGLRFRGSAFTSIPTSSR